MPRTTRAPKPVFGNSLSQSERAPSEPAIVLSPIQTRALIWQIFRRELDTGVKATREEIAAIRAGLAEDPSLSRFAPVPDPVVYYFRVGNRIKIGFTTNVADRARGLMPEEVLGWERGERSLEAERHRQFARHRVNREWFEDCPAIRRHIESLENTMGEPEPVEAEETAAEEAAEEAAGAADEAAADEAEAAE